MLRHLMTLTLAAVGLVMLTANAGAEVTHSAKHGFQIRVTQKVDASADKAYDTLVDIASWWDPSHTYSGKSENLNLETKKGGWFWERLPDDGFIRHMEVVYVAPGKTIRMLGGLGPLQKLGVSGAMTWRVRNEDGQTSVELIYAVGGFYDGGLDQLAPAVNKVLELQMERFAIAAAQAK